MNVSGLINKMEEIYGSYHSDPVLAEDSYGVKRYLVNFFTMGQSAENRVPIGNKRNYHYYVINEGTPSESGYFDGVELSNSYDRDLAGSSLFIVGGIYVDPVMRQRTLGATLKAAYDIINEDPGTANHTERLAWAKSVLLAPDKYSLQMQAFVATNATVQINGGEATDNDIQFIVNSNVNNVAL